MFNTRFKSEYSPDKEKLLIQHLEAAEILLKELMSNMETSKTGANMGENDNLNNCIDTNIIIKAKPELCDLRKMSPEKMDNAIAIALMYQKIKKKLIGMYGDANKGDIINGHDAMDMRKIVFDDLKKLASYNTAYQSIFNELNASMKERAAKSKATKSRHVEEAVMLQKVKELEAALNKSKTP